LPWLRVFSSSLMFKQNNIARLREGENERHPSLLLPPFPELFFSISLGVCTLSINNKASEEFASPGVLSRPISFRKTQIVLASTAKEQ